jgi:hypothetical protein
MNLSQSRPPTLVYHHLLVLVLAFFSFFMSAYISQRTFERLPHLEDEVAYLWQAKLLSTGRTVIDSPDPARAFWQPFIVDFQDNRFGKYSLGWPLMLTPGVLVGQPWVMNAFFAALTVALVYRLGREIFDPDVGVFAAALTAFSPMALLLNGTLMGHTAALFTTTLFLYAYWRLSREDATTPTRWPRSKLAWGAVAGVALGLSVINRPLEGLALAFPFVVWSGLRLAKAVYTQVRLQINTATEDATGTGQTSSGQEIIQNSWRGVLHILAPLLVLAGLASVLVAIIPAYNYAATGNTSHNLYTLVWSYDQVGFGPGYGRNIHTLEKGLRQTRWDLSLTAADLFGWQTQLFIGADGQPRPDLEQHLLFRGDYWPPVGLSWILLPFGLLIGFRRRWLLMGLWLAFGIIVFMQSTTLPTTQMQDPNFANLWMIGAFVWLALPLVSFIFLPRDIQPEWTWLLMGFSLALIILHIAYWIGSQRYSTRYYFEMVAPVAIISALPLAWIARRWRRWPVYVGLTLLLVATLFTYSLPRIHVLYRFNWVSPQLIQAVNRHREGDQPVLVIVRGQEVRWRALGPLMAVTSPMLDSDIVAAIDNTLPGVRERILANFPDRQVIEMTAEGNLACFGNKIEGECYGELP